MDELLASIFAAAYGCVIVLLVWYMYLWYTGEL
jgi:hypothetical protein